MTSSRWSAQRALIAELYINQELPLGKVMEIMETEHNFVATARMYKLNLKNWGLVKYQKHPACCKGKHQTSCPICSIRLREQPKVITDVVLVSRANKVSRLPGPAYFPKTPDYLRIPEECMANIRNYVSGAFSTGIWGRDLTSFSNAEAEAWWAGFANSVDMLRTGKNTAQTFRVLDGLFNKIPHLLKNQQPRLLVAICLAAAVCAGAAPELYVHLVRHVASLSSIYLPGQHPLRLFLEAVARMSSVHFFQYAQVFVEFHLEYLEAWFGDAPERTQGVTGYRGGTYLIFANQELMDLDVAESAYDKLFKIFETMPDRNIAERRRVAAKLSMMAAFEYQNNLKKVEQIAQEVISSRQVIENSEMALHTTTVLMLAASRQKRPEAVIQRAGEIISICERPIQPPPPNMIMRSIQVVDQVLREVGLDEEAERLSKKLDTTILDNAVRSSGSE